MDVLTPLEQQALTLYVDGTTSPTELGRILGVSRQRGQQLIAALRTKVLVTTPSSWAVTDMAHPVESRDNPFPRKARRAMQGGFVLRAADQLRDDGLGVADGVVPDECSVVWTHQSLPRELGWSWTVDRSRVWTMQHTRGTYRQWVRWLQAEHALDSWQLPQLSAGANDYSVAELTRTIAWVISTEAVLYEDLATIPA